MWYLQVTARPGRGTSLEPLYGGANICLWVDTDDEGAAVAAADQVLRNDGWLVDRVLKESFSVTRDTQSAKGMKFFLQAEEDGIAYVALRWPRE